MEGKEFLQVPEIINKTGGEFVRRLKGLSEKKPQPFLRTSISRSYYAAYLHIRDKLIDHCVPDYVKSHERLIRLLESSKFQNCSSDIGGPLKSLRDKRHDADYVLNRSVTERESSSSYKLAKTLIEYFDKINVRKLLLAVKQEAYGIYNEAVRWDFREKWK